MPGPFDSIVMIPRFLQSNPSYFGVDKAYSRSLLIVFSRGYLVVVRFMSEALDLLDCVTALSWDEH